MEYRIVKNEEHNGLEIYFGEKPTEEIRAALKEIKFRWHGVKKCWYGRADRETVENILGGKISEKNGERAEILKKCYCDVVDAYMDPEGGFKGSNSDVPCYEVAPKIREILKKCGIKGVTISQKHFSGGMEIRVKVKVFAGDIREYEEIREQVEDANFIGVCRNNWMVVPNAPAGDERYMKSEDFFKWDGERQREALAFWGRRWYDRARAGKFGSITRGHQVNQKDYPLFTESFFDRWNAVTRIVSSFNYDRSNSQVDYFEVNFYEDYEIIAA